MDKLRQQSQAVRLSDSFKALVKTALFGRVYAGVALAVLVSTSWFWAMLSARVQQGNADQLIDSYLFENHDVFQNALFPGQHTFFVKWPIFWLMKLVNFEPSTFTLFTVGIVLATILSFAYLLYRIERRPLVFGTFVLALASILLLVPAQPYPGGILPVNMAMLTTRNLEYILYIVALILLLRATRIKSLQFCLGVAVLGGLIASDKLFMSLSLGAALAAVVIYALTQRWALVSVSVRWLVAGGFATLVSSLVLHTLNTFHVTHIVSDSTLGPYGFTETLSGLVQGIVYAVVGIASNFGASPASNPLILSTIPRQAIDTLLSRVGLSYVINLAILLSGLYMAGRLLALSIFWPKNRHVVNNDIRTRLSLMLLWSTVAAIGVFVLTNHYYPVDARYLAITVFAVFVASATYLTKYEIQPEKIVVVGAVLLCGIAFGLPASVQLHSNEQAAVANVDKRTALVAQAMQQHHVTTLVGDYWRVVPVKAGLPKSTSILPLNDCTTPREVLTSKAWEKDLKKNSFAYLLSQDQSLSGFPNCDLDGIIATYGKPNASILIEGDLANPTEQLLVYDKGTNIKPVTAGSGAKSPATVVPIALNDVTRTTCSVPTIMNVVAHQDDDLLFINPDLIHDIRAERCVRTIYVTAGDAGQDQYYWLSREQGAEAAYAKMLGVDDLWIQRIVRLPGGQFVTIANPRGNTKVSLVFLRLPDGGIKGHGFDVAQQRSLERLENGQTTTIKTVDGQSSYTADQLTDALDALMQAYRPAEIHTQSSHSEGPYPDHSDHVAVSKITQRARHMYVTQQYDGLVDLPIKFYRGYTGLMQIPNVSDGDFADKEAAFMEYVKFDRASCSSKDDCLHSSVYGEYLSRQYQAER